MTCNGPKLADERTDERMNRTDEEGRTNGTDKQTAERRNERTDAGGTANERTGTQTKDGGDEGADANGLTTVRTDDGRTDGQRDERTDDKQHNEGTNGRPSR
ncbi:hypothetical protein DPMN_092949 [Dreissena polymorpha]|uniref:Uncharacterized protein n=1 Tax=Dreissena polymorpha TaxID=45954 RepID=A0A9D4L292_DREPO|nr:hypothetical protein DPMN_092949 [Dreissena polymorpha]